MQLIALSLVSAGVIGFQLVLMRLYAIGQWHHFAYMIISIALLGYGASGTCLALLRAPLLARFDLAWRGFALGFGLSAVVGFAFARELVFNPFELAWDPGQAAALSLTYLLLMVPFFCAANCVGLAFMHFADRIGQVYRFDLVGSGVGAAATVAALFVVPPADALRLVALLGFASAAVAGLGGTAPGRLPRSVALLALGVLVAVLMPGTWLAPRLSDYKDLKLALQVPGAVRVHEAASPLALVTVVDSPQVPLRYAPGLSLASHDMPPQQLGLFVDGNGTGAITRFDGRRETLAYLDWSTAALPYHMATPRRILLLGARGGDAVLLARYHGAETIEVVETDPALARTLRDRFDGFAGGVYSAPGTVLHVAEPRGFVAGTRRRYDLIELGAGGDGSGLGGLSETYGLTVEAVSDYVARLTPGGLLSVSLPLGLPPRAAPKLIATFAAALRKVGAEEPARHVAAVRTWNLVTLVAGREPLGVAMVASLRRFAAERAFDPVYFPGMARAEANRTNVLAEPYFYEAATALLAPGSADFSARYKFDIRPARDDRPYFFDFMKWRSLGELLALRRQGAMPLIEWGPLVLLATLLQAGALSAVLVLLPLTVGGHGPAPRGRGTVAGYFLALGFAFFFLEIAFIQRLVLFLGHPLYAVAVVLAAFLVFAGIGAGLSPRLEVWLESRGGRLRAVELAVAGIAASAFLFLLLFPAVSGALAAAPVAAKVAAGILLMAPLALFMGMPFPLGLSRVAARAPALVPWAWGLNGCASVLSAVLAMLLAIEFGFTVVVATALVLYVLAATIWRVPF